MSRTGPHPEPLPLSPEAALASIADCVSVLLASSQTLRSDSPAAIAFNRAIRRFGEQAIALGGMEVLEDLRLRLVDDAPNHAVVRRTMLALAWSGLAGEER